MTHELTHTIQQAGSQPAVVSRVTDPAAPAEQEANSAASVLVEKCFVPARASSVRLARQAATRLEQGTASGSSECVPAPGIPNSNCSAYMANAWWLPLAYVNNATCACRSTPNVPSANCVRRFLQDRLAVTPSWLKVLAASQKPLEANPVTHGPYQTFVQAMLTPRIYGDHVDAYRSCCCPSGPAPFPAWIGVTLVPIQPCSLVGLTIRYFGSCSGTPGAW